MSADFYEQYELLEAPRGEGVLSAGARRVRSGRKVFIHFLVAGKDRVVRQLAALPLNAALAVVDQGEIDQRDYLVTRPAPGFTTLEDWLREYLPEGEAATSGDRPTGTMHLPAAEAAKRPGEFTSIFLSPRARETKQQQSKQEESKQQEPNRQEPEPGRAASPEAAEQPGDFTSKFLTPKRTGSRPLLSRRLRFRCRPRLPAQDRRIGPGDTGLPRAPEKVRPG